MTLIYTCFVDLEPWFTWSAVSAVLSHGISSASSELLGCHHYHVIHIVPPLSFPGWYWTSQKAAGISTDDEYGISGGELWRPWKVCQHTNQRLHNFFLFPGKYWPLVQECPLKSYAKELVSGYTFSSCYFNSSCTIDAVTGDDVQRVAKDMLKSRPALAVLGDLSKIPSLKDIDQALLPTNKGTLPRRGRLLFPRL